MSDTQTSFQSLLDRLDHFSDEFPDIREGVRKAILVVDLAPDLALTGARKVLESMVRDVFEKRIQEPAGTQPLEGLLQRLFQNDHLPPLVNTYAHGIRELGNIGTHKRHDCHRGRRGHCPFPARCGRRMVCPGRLREPRACQETTCKAGRP